ncbi:MAG: hypothetical protein CMM40_05615 [Rhodospirillaceae bacterium]|mgnify:CR=1 FL=1|nr:hypothetical protein [Rhodospirillaceae bacterium]|tara:strand:- start:78922 stop:80721 length:1800 start_codon:yes stop_codon:yes gene_type:complete
MGLITQSLPSQDLDKVLRARYVASGAARRAPEMVVKLISSAMERDSARNMVYYIGRVRARDRQDEAEQVTLYHADGEVAVNGRASFADARRAARDVFDAWIPPGTQSGTVAEGSAAEPLRPWVHHLTASYPVIEQVSDLQAARAAAAAVIQEAFETLDYPVLWAMHNTPSTVDESWPLDADERTPEPHGHVHIHILVRTWADPLSDEDFGPDVSETEEPVPPLSFDREDFAALRALFAGYGQMNGLEVEATRPIDRVSEMIAREQDLIRDQIPLSEGDQARRDRSKGRLSDRAPDWNPDVIEILYESDRGDRPGPEGDLDQVLQDDPAAALFQARFEAAELALLRWRLLRRELARREGSAKLADWYLEKRPEVFGPKVDGPGVFGEPKVTEAPKVSQTEPEKVAAPTDRQRAMVQAYDDAYEGLVQRYEDPDGLPPTLTVLTASSELPQAETASGSPSRSLTTALASLEALAVFSERRWPQEHPLGDTAARIRAQSERLQEEIALVRPESDGGVDIEERQLDQSRLHGDGGGDGGTGVDPDAHPEGPPPSPGRSGEPVRRPVLYEPLPSVPPATPSPNPAPERGSGQGRGRSDDFDLGD